MCSRLLTIAGAFTVSILVSPALIAQDQPTSTYSKNEIDAKLNDLESKSDADARFRDVYKRDEVDRRIGDLRNLISQNATKADVDAKIADVQKAFKTALDSSEATNAQRKADLEKLIAATDSKIPTFPPWVAVVISALAVAVSIFLGNQARITSTNLATEAKNTSTRLANEAKDEARRSVREARAYSVIAEWRGLRTEIGRALDLFLNPNKLVLNGAPVKPNYAILVDVGNWYDGMAEQWHSGTTDSDVLQRNGLKEQAKEFWDGLQAARTTLPDLDRQIAAWTNLQWLANQP